MWRELQKTTEQKNEVDEYARALWSGFGSGVKRMADFIRSLADPINLLYPFSSVFIDTGIIIARHQSLARNSQAENFELLYPEVLPVFEYIVTKNPQTYTDATNNMQRRINALKAAGQEFVNASLPKKIAAITDMATTIYLPGILFKGAKLGLNYFRFGMFNPPIFHNIGLKRDLTTPLPPVPMRSITDLKQVKDAQFMYVITDKGKLLICDDYYPKHLVSNPHGLVNFVSHPELAQSKPVMAAGRIEIENGMLNWIRDDSGHYLPTGHHLNGLTEKIFARYGFPEAHGKFISIKELFSDIFRKYPNTSMPMITRENLFMPSPIPGLVIELTPLPKNNENKQEKNRIEEKNKSSNTSQFWNEQKKSSFHLASQNSATDHLPPPAQATFEQVAAYVVKLCDQVSPSSLVIAQHADDLLQRVKKATQGRSFDSAQELIEDPHFKNELKRLGIEKKLSPRQLDFMTFFAIERHRKTELAGETVTPVSWQESKIPPRGVKKELLKENLDALESALSQDFKRGEKGRVYQLVQQATDEDEKSISSISSNSRSLQLQDRSERIQKWQQRGSEWMAVGGLLGQIGYLSESENVTKIGAVVSGGAHLALGVASFLSGNPLMGFVGIGNAICTWWSGLRSRPREEDGLSVVNRKIDQGFDRMLRTQIQLALQFREGFEFLDRHLVHIDNQLLVLDEHVMQSYQLISKQISIQQAFLSEQISTFARQISQQIDTVELHILQGLQLVHADITQRLQVTNQGITHLSRQFSEGISHLDQKVQILSQELRLQMIQQMQRQESIAKNILLNQEEHSRILQQQTRQLQVSYLRSLEDKHQRCDEKRIAFSDKHTEHAKEVLQKNFDLQQFNPAKISLGIEKAADNKLTGGSCKLTNPEMICNQLGSSADWSAMDPFDVINLLKNYALYLGFDQETAKLFQQPLIHVPTWQINMQAYIKWLKQQKSVGEESKENINDLKQYANQCLLLLQFCYALTEPVMLSKLFADAGQTVVTLGNSLTQTLEIYQIKLTTSCQDRLQQGLNIHQNILQEHNILKPLSDEVAESLKILRDARKKQIDALEIELFNEVKISYPLPLAYFVAPGREEKNHQLVLVMDEKKLPVLPKKILALEALGAGWIQFNYSYDAPQKKLAITVAFQITRSEKLPLLLTKKIIDADAEQSNGLLNVWNQFTWPSNQEITLPEESQKELDNIYEHVLIELRLQLNYQLQRELTLSKEYQCLEAVEARAGLLHAALKFSFQTAYHDPNSVVTDILQTCLTVQQLENSLANYDGRNIHPCYVLQKADVHYQQHADRLIKAMEQRKLAVHNSSLNHILLLIDSILLILLPPSEQLSYLTDLLERLPRNAKGSTYSLRAGWQLTQRFDMAAALADYTAAIQLHSDNSLLRYHRGRCLQALGSWEEAAKEYTSSLELLEKVRSTSTIEPQNMEDIKQQQITILISRGDAYVDGGLYAAACADYQQACDLCPDQVELLCKRAYSYECLEQLELAKEDYEKILKLEPNSVVGLDGLARCNLKTDVKTAFSLYLKLLENFPDMGNLMFQCATLAGEIDANDKRINEWLTTAAKDPWLPLDDRISATELLAKRKKISVAIQSYQQFWQKVTTETQHKRCTALVECLFKRNTNQYVKYYTHHSEMALRLSPRGKLIYQDQPIVKKEVGSVVPQLLKFNVLNTQCQQKKKSLKGKQVKIEQHENDLVQNNNNRFTLSKSSI